MMIKNIAAAVATVAILGFALPAFAEETVSDEVDQALWCGAAYVAVTLVDGMSAEDVAAADEAATAVFEQAKLAMDEDGIEESEYTRLVEYYTEIAVENLVNPDAELRYTDEECTALIAE